VPFERYVSHFAGIHIEHDLTPPRVREGFLGVVSAANDVGLAPRRRLGWCGVDAVEVRRSPRARRWRLEVPWGEPPRLTVPGRMGRVEVERVLAEKRPWIEEQRRRQVPRLGLERLAVSESEARIGARELVAALAEEEAERIGVAYERIRIGAQRTLWASCSPRGTLSFNWRLVLAPLDVADYVVVHELCHLSVPDHSRSFWTLVERHRPHWRDQRDWLRKHGSELLAFRPSD
jgi:predicted metal-dependent hydrolase